VFLISTDCFAFNTSAEDAEYLAEELGGGLNKQDLLELGHYQCYARVSDVRTGERSPASGVRLDVPPVADPAVADRLAAASAERYGRNVSTSNSICRLRPNASGIPKRRNRPSGSIRNLGILGTVQLAHLPRPGNADLSISETEVLE
jgi:hypothetical protein